MVTVDEAGGAESGRSSIKWDFFESIPTQRPQPERTEQARQSRAAADVRQLCSVTPAVPTFVEESLTGKSFPGKS